MKLAWIIGVVGFALVAVALALDHIGRGFGAWGGLARLIGRTNDLGPASFPTLVRRTTPNDALVCPADFCRAAKADLEAPIFAMPADELGRRLDAVVRAEPRISNLHVGPGGHRRRLVQKSALLRFPDVIDGDIIAVDPTHSTLALYSRSVIGISDLGVNRARLARWLDALTR
jgi:uncharacterized protein (DUF1499 family)